MPAHWFNPWDRPKQQSDDNNNFSNFSSFSRTHPEKNIIADADNTEALSRAKRLYEACLFMQRQPHYVTFTPETRKAEAEAIKRLKHQIDTLTAANTRRP